MQTMVIGFHLPKHNHLYDVRIASIGTLGDVKNMEEQKRRIGSVLMQYYASRSAAMKYDDCKFIGEDGGCELLFHAPDELERMCPICMDYEPNGNSGGRIMIRRFLCMLFGHKYKIITEQTSFYTTPSQVCKCKRCGKIFN